MYQQDPHKYISIDYRDGWLGFRIEPENQARADAIKLNIPDKEGENVQRMWIRQQRKWLIKPKWILTMMNILDTFCHDFPVIIEEKHRPMIVTLIIGPKELRQDRVVQPATDTLPQGYVYDSIHSMWEQER